MPLRTLLTIVTEHTEHTSPIKYLPWLAVGGSILGVANLLWTMTEDGKFLRMPLRVLLVRVVCAAVLSAGASMVPMMLLWEVLAEDYMWALIGGSVVFGIGGATAFDFIAGALRFVVNLKIGRKGGGSDGA